LPKKLHRLKSSKKQTQKQQKQQTKSLTIEVLIDGWFSPRWARTGHHSNDDGR
jgi:hypothetical protein